MRLSATAPSPTPTYLQSLPPCPRPTHSHIHSRKHRRYLGPILPLTTQRTQHSLHRHKQGNPHLRIQCMPSRTHSHGLNRDKDLEASPRFPDTPHCPPFKHPRHPLIPTLLPDTSRRGLSKILVPQSVYRMAMLQLHHNRRPRPRTSMALAKPRCPRQDTKVHNTTNHGITPRSDEKWLMAGKNARRANWEALSRSISNDGWMCGISR
jgi:hypothetical protein